MMRTLNNTKIFRSIRFEYFLSLLKNSYCIIGNSSSGVREAPFYGVPTIDIGSRQKNRAKISSKINSNNFKEIRKLIYKFKIKKFRFKPLSCFGSGNSDKKFLQILNQERIWRIKSQKQFVQLNFSEKNIQKL